MTKRRPNAWALPIVLLLLLHSTVISCARIQTDIGTPLVQRELPAQTDPIDTADVLHLYGPPSRITALSVGSAFLYEYVQIDEYQWGVILPGNIGKYFKAVYSKSKASADIATFTFDPEGLLVAQATSNFETHPGGGFGLTIIFKIKSLSDIETYTQAQQGTLQWGGAWLQSLPRTLNTNQDMDSGTNGIELNRLDGTIGQRTLEMGRTD